MKKVGHYEWRNRINLKSPYIQICGRKYVSTSVVILVSADGLALLGTGHLETGWRGRRAALVYLPDRYLNTSRPEKSPKLSKILLCVLIQISLKLVFC